MYALFYTSSVSTVLDDSKVGLPPDTQITRGAQDSVRLRSVYTVAVAPSSVHVVLRDGDAMASSSRDRWTGTPPAVPDWQYAHPEVEGCRCVLLNPRHAFREDVEFEGARFTRDEPMIVFRCKFFSRPGGCSKGEFCDHCHIHPKPRHEEDHSQRILCSDGTVRQLHRHERIAQQRALTDEQRTGKLAYRRMLKAIQQDQQHYINFGRPVMDGRAHFVVWTVHRLEEQATKTQQHIAEVGGDLFADANDVGRWMGADKKSFGQLHYPMQEEAHGVHTLHKGFATRLRQLARQTTAEVIILHESDARWCQAMRQVGFEEVINMACEGPFLWIGFFTNQPKNHYGTWDNLHMTPAEAFEEGLIPEAVFRHNEANNIMTTYKKPRPGTWPWVFKGRAEDEVCPGEACHIFSLRRDFVDEFVRRLETFKRPFGMDMLFHSRDLFSNSEARFLSRSLGGQEPGMSDSWQKLNLRAGPIEEPQRWGGRIWQLRVRDFSEVVLRNKRSDMWARHLSFTANPRKWEENRSFREWLRTDPPQTPLPIAAAAPAPNPPRTRPEPEPRSRPEPPLKAPPCEPSVSAVASMRSQRDAAAAPPAKAPPATLGAPELKAAPPLKAPPWEPSVSAVASMRSQRDAAGAASGAALNHSTSEPPVDTRMGRLALAALPRNSDSGSPSPSPPPRSPAVDQRTGQQPSPQTQPPAPLPPTPRGDAAVASTATASSTSPAAAVHDWWSRLVPPPDWWDKPEGGWAENF